MTAGSKRVVRISVRSERLEEQRRPRGALPSIWQTGVTLGLRHGALNGLKAAGAGRRTRSAHVLIAGQVREPQRDIVAGTGCRAAVDAELQAGAHLGAHEAQLRVAPLLRRHCVARLGDAAAQP